MRRLSEAVRLHVAYDDATRYGAAAGRFDRELQLRMKRVFATAEARGLQYLIDHGAELLSSALQQPDVAELYRSPDVLKDEVLFPESERMVPRALLVEPMDSSAQGPEQRSRPAVSIPLPRDWLPEAASWLGDWQRGAAEPRSAAALGVYRALEAAGALDDGPPPEPAMLAAVTMVGHATVRLQHGAGAVLLDPFLFGPSPQNPAGLQPLTPSELGPLDAVFITHSHPDHFDLGSLLRLGADIPIYVPDVPRESVLCPDLEFRLRQVGFRQVRTMAHWQTVSAGDIRVTAMPFYGEQPTERDPLPEHVRSFGNTYWFQLGDKGVACVADAGRDHAGDVQDLAIEAKAKLGTPELLLSGYRGYGLYPIQYLLSSTPSFALFVPREKWAARQRIMCDAEEVINVAELWGARTVIPYADGGAPWFWRMGLGPALDGSKPINRAVDPEPEEVVRAGRRRSGSQRYGALSSWVRVHLLRPGQGVDLQPEFKARNVPEWPFRPADARAELDRLPEFCKRYAHEDWGTRKLTGVTATGETLSLVKKKALLGLLARRYAAELDRFPGSMDVQRTSDNFRRVCGLRTRAELLAFLEEQQLDLDTWFEIMTDICAIESIEAVHDAAVLARVPALVRVWSARSRHVRKDED